MPDTGFPLLNFMIIGAQKCGTTALFEYLKQHPEIGMSAKKEVHLFDNPDYSSAWASEQIDERYRGHFEHFAEDPSKEAGSGAGQNNSIVASESSSKTVLTRGEATPIYLFLPEIAGELKRYNPALKLIVLLRDPVDRAISHYYMEKNRGYERLPLWLALLAEPWRLWRCKDPRGYGSAWRRHTYRRRGLYSSQLRNLYRYFDEKQVLLICSKDLASRHDQVLRRVFHFLGVSEREGIEPHTPFKGNKGSRHHRAVTLLLRLSYLPELRRLRTLSG